MIKNFVYVELGPELVCHDKLYQNALRKQEKIKEQRYQQELANLIQQVNEIEDEWQPKQQTKDFYDYSMKWKNHVQQKKFQEQYVNEVSVSQKTTTPIQKLPKNYISPIEGWKEHAQQYFEKKENKTDNESTFQPSINEKSRTLVYDEPVEDRLLKYGQQREQKYLFEKQFEKFYDEVQQSQRPTRPNEEVFDRLYNHERKQPQQETYSLTINKLTPELEEKVKKRREQYSLFDCKQTRVATETNDQQIKVLSQNQFDEFLKRNFARHYRAQSVKEENQEQHSFQPELNKKSIEIANKTGDTLIERQEKFLQKKQQVLQQHQEKQQQQQEQFEEEIKNQQKPNAKIHVNKPSKSPLRQNAYNLQHLVKQKVPELF